VDNIFESMEKAAEKVRNQRKELEQKLSQSKTSSMCKFCLGVDGVDLEERCLKVLGHPKHSELNSLVKV